MQVLAWIPLLQIAPTLAAGGGSVVRFLIGMLALVVGNASLIAMAALLGDSFGSAVAALGLGLTGLLCLFYFGRIACNTATARDLPAWMGLVLLVPILNFFIYPYFAFHDGWIGPNKAGLVIGSALVIGGLAPTFDVVRQMNENGGPSSALLLAMSQAGIAGFAETAGNPFEISVDSADPTSIALMNDSPMGSPNSEPQSSQSEGQAIRALYKLKTRFDALNSLATPESLLVDDHRVRALGIIQAIRTDLEAHRETLDASTYGKLATHLLDIEARVHAQSAPTLTTRGSRTTTRNTQFAPAAPAALDPAGRTRTPSYSDLTAPPVRPYPVQASNECPEGTESRTKEHEHGEDEWCQQLSAYGGLRHGSYARYHQDGRPESMGQYENGLRVGVWTRFYPTGEVRAQAEFRKGMQHGWVLAFDKAGERTRSARFEGGAPVHAD